MRIVIMILICLPLFSFSCKNRKAIAEKEIVPMQETLQEEIKPINIVRTLPPDLDPFKVTDLQIKGSILAVSVEYSGGTAKHKFDLYTNMMIMKSMPPKLNVFLQHNANEDQAEALISKTLLFDISVVNQQYEKMIISINNYDQSVDLIKQK